MLSNFLIGLREGLEASLIVAILVAYLVKRGEHESLRKLWIGVGAAIVLALGFGAFLQLTSQTLSDTAAETFGGVTSIIAVILITWMIFWMASHARTLKSHLHGEVDKALLGNGWAIAFVAFVAVIREGMETALFLWTGIRAAGSSATPIIGALLGLALATAIGYIIYRGAVKLNLSKLFTWTGVALIIVAAGVLSYGIHELQEVGILPFMNSYAFDVSTQIPPDGGLGTLLRGTFNFRPATTWLEFFAWWAYVIPVMTLYIRKVRGPRPPAQAPSAKVPTGASL